MTDMVGSTELLTQPRERPAPALSLVTLGLAYLGLEATYHKAVFQFGPLSAGLIVAFCLAALGWRRPMQLAAAKRYMLWAFLFGVWLVITSIAAWDPRSLSESLRIAPWLVFIVPGIASLLRHERNRRALLLGLAIGAGVYVVAASTRLVRDEPVLDVISREPTAALLGTNRNAINMGVLLVVPFALAGLGIFRRAGLRWLFLALASLWLVNSGGRSGLVGVVVVAVVFALLQPSASRRLRLVLAVVLIGSVAFAWIQGSGGQAAVSTERLVDVMKGKRTEADEARELILRKAWDLATDNVVFGVGLTSFEGTYSPVVERASSARVRRIAIEYNEHNTYAEILGETGFPGLLVFIGILAVLIAAGVRRTSDRWTRAATCTLCAAAFVVFFHSAIGVLLFYPFALLLGSLGDRRAADVT